jgi:tetratricopeptide (TPR) repeat protein
MNRSLCPLAVGLLLFAASLPRPARAASPDAVATFLQNGVGGRSAALSDCYTALGAGPFGSWYNPAGPLAGEGLEAGYQYESFGLDVVHNTLAGRWPWGTGTAGVLLDIFSYGSVAGRDASGALTGTKLSPADSLLSLGYGLPLGGAWRAGANLGVYTVDLGAEKWNGLVLDLGGLWTPAEDWTLGAALKNLGTGHANTSLPTTLRLGAAYAAWGPYWLLTSELELPLSRTFSELGLGTEVRPWEWLDLRLGLRRPLAGGDSGPDGLSVGLGFNFGSFGLDLSILSRGDFGVRNSLTLVYAFGHARTAPLATPTPSLPAAALPAGVPAPLPMDQAEFHFKAGLEYERLRRYVDAIVEYKAALQARPDHAAAETALARVTARAKEEAKAAAPEAAAPAQAALLKSIRRHYDLGLEAYNSRNYVTAIRELKLVLELNAQYTEATELLEKVRSTLSRELAALRKQAESAREADDLAREIGACQRMLTLDPGNDEAQTQLRAARQKLPKRVESLYLKGVDLYARGEYREAMKTFEVVLDLDPGHAKSKEAVQKIKEKLLQTGQ